jgi:hypothetical protein
MTEPDYSMYAVSARTPQLSHDERELFRQQEWLWRCDSMHEPGDVLRAYGFERDPASELGAECFTLPGAATVSLCDGVIVYATDGRGTLVLSAPDYVPSLIASRWVDPLSERWISRAVPAKIPLDRHTLSALLPPLMAWIGSYERWVLDTYGIDYRKRCLENVDCASCDAAEIPALWWEAASRWREVLAR